MSVTTDFTNELIISNKKDTGFSPNNGVGIVEDPLDEMRKKTGLTFQDCYDFYQMVSWGESSYFEALELDKNKDIKNKFSKSKKRIEGEEGEPIWIKLYSSEELNIGKKHQYFGVAYAKVSRSLKLMVVFAHRGTCLNLGNITADLILALQQKPGILDSAFSYVTKILNFSKQFGLEIESVTHVGFSLGGYIAGACVVLNPLEEILTHAVTLDAPGIHSLLPSSVSPEKFWNCIWNIVGFPNIVNTANAHLGKVIKVHCHDKYKEDFNKIAGTINTSDLSTISSLAGEFGKFGMYTFKVHNMDIFKEALKRGRKKELIHHWPTAQISVKFGSTIRADSLANPIAQILTGCLQKIMGETTSGAALIEYALSANEVYPSEKDASKLIASATIVVLIVVFLKTLELGTQKEEEKKFLADVQKQPNKAGSEDLPTSAPTFQQDLLRFRTAIAQMSLKITQPPVALPTPSSSQITPSFSSSSSSNTNAQSATPSFTISKPNESSQAGPKEVVGKSKKVPTKILVSGKKNKKKFGFSAKINEAE